MIWQRIKSGDLDALGALYDEYIEILIQYGNNLCLDRDYVKDCIHDLFLDIYKYRKNLGRPVNIEYYLLRSLKNKILKNQNSRLVALRSENKFDSHHKELCTSSEEDNIIDYELSVEKTLKLAAAMNSLTDQQRRSINLRFKEERSYGEIADILKVSIETARTLIYRGIKSLRQSWLTIWILTFFFSNSACG